MTNPFDIELARIEEERKRLDGMLDDALAQFAQVEEEMNARMKTATPAQLQALMEERARIEDSLGIVALVDRLDELRARAALIKSAAASAT